MSSRTVESQMILATVMEGIGNGNKDEYFTLSIANAGIEEKRDSFGRLKAIFNAATKGYQSFYI